jgi:hypothetical protein
MDLFPRCRSPLSGYIQSQPVAVPAIRPILGQDEMLVISEAELAKIEGSTEQFEQQLGMPPSDGLDDLCRLLTSLSFNYPGTRSRPVTVRDVPEEGDREAPILIPDENGYLPGDFIEIPSQQVCFAIADLSAQQASDGWRT